MSHKNNSILFFFRSRKWLKTWHFFLGDLNQGVVLTCEMVMIPLDTGLKTTKNAISREEAANIVNDMYRFVFYMYAFDSKTSVSLLAGRFSLDCM